VIRYLCDRVGVMYRGKLVEMGATEQVITAPVHAYTKALISAVPWPDPKRRGIANRHRYVEET
jgi:peptide/nickel transport system ATP-binding protein